MLDHSSRANGRGIRSEPAPPPSLLASKWNTSAEWWKKNRTRADLDRHRPCGLEHLEERQVLMLPNRKDGSRELGAEGVEWSSGRV